MARATPGVAPAVATATRQGRLRLISLGLTSEAKACRRYRD
jgi:hypothetical protein